MAPSTTATSSRYGSKKATIRRRVLARRSLGTGSKSRDGPAERAPGRDPGGPAAPAAPHRHRPTSSQPISPTLCHRERGSRRRDGVRPVSRSPTRPRRMSAGGARHGPGARRSAGDLDESGGREVSLDGGRIVAGANERMRVRRDRLHEWLDAHGAARRAGPGRRRRTDGAGLTVVATSVPPGRRPHPQVRQRREPDRRNARA